MSIEAMKAKDEWLKNLNKEAKMTVGVWGNKYESSFLVPTGIFNLDAVLGGGLPLGKTSLISGIYSGGKSTVSLMCAANAQKFDRISHKLLEYSDDGTPFFVDNGEICETPMSVLLIDAEGAYDARWAKKLGVITDNLVVITPDYLQNAYEYILSAIKAHLFDLIIFDSLAASPPKEELEANIEEWQIGLAARLNSKGIRTLNTAMQQAGRDGAPMPGLILVNQIRKTMGGMYKPAEIVPGGEAQKFHASVHVEFRPGKPEENKDGIYARNSTWRVLKNRLNGITSSGEFMIYVKDYGNYKKGQINSVQQVLELAIRFGLVRQAGAWVFIGEEKFQGISKAEAYLIENSKIYENLYETVSQLILKNSKD